MSKIDDIANQFADAVRDAFAQVYGKPRRPEYSQAVAPTWSEHGVAVGWHDPDPGVVLIFSEYRWIEDPWSLEFNEQPNWEKAMSILREKGWDNVAYESINSAVHIVYWLPPDKWQTILNKRSRDRMNP